MALEAFRIRGVLIVNEKGAVARGAWRDEHFAKAHHMGFAEDISIINGDVPIIVEIEEAALLALSL